MNSTTTTLPPFKFSLGVEGSQGSSVFTMAVPGKLEQTPHVNHGNAVYLRMETDGSYSNRRQILSLYRGKAYYTGGIHLQLVQGKWCFVYSQGNDYKYFTPTEVVEWRRDGKPFRPPGLPEINMAVHSTDYNQVVYGGMTIAGKKIVALKLYEEWLSYWEANKGALVQAMREADIAHIDEQLKELDREENEAREELEKCAAVRAELEADRLKLL